MRLQAVSRAVAAVLVFVVCALLLGLSQAEHLTPGDAFQVARVGHVATVHGAVHVPNRDATAPLAVGAEVAPGTGPSGLVGTVGRTGNSPRPAWFGEPAGCRGPPTS
ncbi:hypothetical protein AB0M46_47015 [Dactylosporangium sp. NPDC051485]|uniref:hypothetical protein n=1 Tax=Dactylosporangium sp. NPDC051485 TaxID=3154846 RepID=UPI0034227C51